ncbi:glycosyltransferase [Pedobacter sp. P351]|uniref:glycosyltransferase n=1 Tax=Pedobacter superstes TaxID=3133441 RepID=UPI00309D35E1
MKSLKVLHVIAGMDPKAGGVCQAVRMIISGLKDHDIINEVISLDSANARYLVGLPFVVHAIGEGKGPWGYNGRLRVWLTEHLKEYEIVILHGLWLYPGYALRKSLDLLRRDGQANPKFFVMPHGMLDPYFQLAPGRRLKAIRNRIFWNLIERKIINDADGLLFTCEMEMILARKTFKKYFPKKELIVGLGIEAAPPYSEAMSEAFKAKLPMEEIGSYLLFISRIHEKKGIDLLVKAYSNLKVMQPGIPALVIAGPGLETEFGKTIQQLARECSDIYFTGMLTGNAKWGAFFECEAFVLPSHQENFGIAVVEAMACAKPVLISNQVNIWKEILNSGGGLVSDDSLWSVQDMLEKWIALSKDEKKLMGVCAKACFESNFAVKPSALRLINAINPLNK